MADGLAWDDLATEWKGPAWRSGVRTSTVRDVPDPSGRRAEDGPAVRGRRTIGAGAASDYMVGGAVRVHSAEGERDYGGRRELLLGASDTTSKRSRTRNT